MGNVNGINSSTQNSYFAGTIHMPSSPGASSSQWDSQDKTNSTAIAGDDQYHTFTCVWEDTGFAMYLDGVPYYYKVLDPSKKTDNTDWSYYMNKDYHILLNMAVGGNYTGIHDASTITALPNANDQASMYVDYVRVYQKEVNITKPGSDDPVVPTTTYSLIGGYNGKTAWDITNDAIDFEYNEAQGNYTVTIPSIYGQFKIVKNHAWDGVLSYTTSTISAGNTYEFSPNSGEGEAYNAKFNGTLENIKLTLTPIANSDNVTLKVEQIPTSTPSNYDNVVPTTTSDDPKVTEEHEHGNIAFTWSTEDNGNVTITVNPVDAADNTAFFRGTKGMNGTFTLNKDQTFADYFEIVKESGNVSTVTLKLKDSAKRPADGTIISYSGEIECGTTTHGNDWSKYSFAGYNYGSVRQAVALTGLSVSETSITLVEDDTHTLSPIFTPANADDKDVVWSSSNTAVATVDQTGKVTAIAAGNATITVKSAKNAEISATCAVTVNEPTGPEPVAGNIFEYASASISSTHFTDGSWNPDTESTATYNNKSGVLKIHLDKGKDVRWQSQVVLTSNLTSYSYKPGYKYDISFTLKADQNIPNALVKLDDKAGIIIGTNITNAGHPEGVKVELNNYTYTFGETNGLIVFDFGNNIVANTNIEISDIVVKEHLPATGYIKGNGTGEVSDTDIPAESPYSGYTLAWSDEFKGAVGQPNEKYWNVEINNDGGGNGELQAYCTNGVFVNNGNLILTATNQDYDGQHFTSGRVNTIGNVSFKYGILEARIKMPNTFKGLWPAFWTMGNDFTTSGWPACGELDIVEMGMAGGLDSQEHAQSFVNGALHYGPNNDGHQQVSGAVVAPFNIQDGEYHVFRCEWTEDRIICYVDNGKAKTDPQWTELKYFDVPNGPDNYFKHFNYYLFNLAVGSKVDGYVGLNTEDQITALPQTDSEQSMYIDYVRVYQPAEQQQIIITDEYLDGVKQTVDPTNAVNSGKVYLIEGSKTTYNNLRGAELIDLRADNKNRNFMIWDAGSTMDGSYDDVAGCRKMTIKNGINWTGASYTLKFPTDLSDITDNYTLRLKVKANTAAELSVTLHGNGSAKIAIDPSICDGNVHTVDVPLKLFAANGLTYTDETAFTGNALEFSIGGNAGAAIDLYDIYLYGAKDNDGYYVRAKSGAQADGQVVLEKGESATFALYNSAGNEVSATNWTTKPSDTGSITSAGAYTASHGIPTVVIATVNGKQITHNLDAYVNNGDITVSTTAHQFANANAYYVIDLDETTFQSIPNQSAVVDLRAKKDADYKFDIWGGWDHPEIPVMTESVLTSDQKNIYGHNEYHNYKLNLKDDGTPYYVYGGITNTYDKAIDLSGITDDYTLHIDIRTTTNNTINFVINGNGKTTVSLGAPGATNTTANFTRNDGNWYGIDIPMSVLINQGLSFNDITSFVGELMSIQTGEGLTKDDNFDIGGIYFYGPAQSVEPEPKTVFIHNYAELQEFALNVNSGDVTYQKATVYLVNDFAMTAEQGAQYVGIGSHTVDGYDVETSIPFMGTFTSVVSDEDLTTTYHTITLNGTKTGVFDEINGASITGVYTAGTVSKTTPNVGALVDHVSGTGTVNIKHCVNSATVNGTVKVAGIVGRVQGSSDTNPIQLNLTSVLNEGNVTASGESNVNAAGIIGCVTAAEVHARNIGNVGAISGANESAAFFGWLGNNSDIINSYNAGQVTNGMDDKNNLYRTNATVTLKDASVNNATVYDTFYDGDGYQGELKFSQDDVANETLYRDLMNDDDRLGVDGVYRWYQHQPEDTHPVFLDSSAPVTGEYYIYNATQMDEFAKGINNGTIPVNATAYLMADIDMSTLGNDYSYPGIGSTEAHTFTGRFISLSDKDDKESVTEHTINLGTSATGVFGRVNGAYIEGVNVEGTINATTNDVGALVNNSTGNTTIVNCENAADVTSTGDNVGGLVGMVWNNNNTTPNTLTIRNVVNRGDVTASTKASGIIGRIDNTNLVMINALNEGAINSSTTADNANAAGLIGCQIGNEVSVTVINSGNTGAVTGKTGECAAFAGWIESTTVNFTNCYNSGVVTGQEGDKNLVRANNVVTDPAADNTIWHNVYDASTAAGETPSNKAQGWNAKEDHSAWTVTDVKNGALLNTLNIVDVTSYEAKPWVQTVGSDDHPVFIDDPVSHIAEVIDITNTTAVVHVADLGVDNAPVTVTYTWLKPNAAVGDGTREEKLSRIVRESHSQTVYSKAGQDLYIPLMNLENFTEQTVTLNVNGVNVPLDPFTTLDHQKTTDLPTGAQNARGELVNTLIPLVDFEPGWSYKDVQDYSADPENQVYTYTMPNATNERWQAQFRKPIGLQPDGKVVSMSDEYDYDVLFYVKTSNPAELVVKLESSETGWRGFDGTTSVITDLNHGTLTTEEMELDEEKGYPYVITNLKGQYLPGAILVVDLSNAAANTEVTISDISVIEKPRTSGGTVVDPYKNSGLLIGNKNTVTNNSVALDMKGYDKENETFVNGKEVIYTITTNVGTEEHPEYMSWTTTGIGGQLSTYVVSGLDKNTEYTFNIKAQLEDGNIVGPKEGVNVTATTLDYDIIMNGILYAKNDPNDGGTDNNTYAHAHNAYDNRNSTAHNENRTDGKAPSVPFSSGDNVDKTINEWPYAISYTVTQNADGSLTISGGIDSESAKITGMEKPTLWFTNNDNPIGGYEYIFDRTAPTAEGTSNAFVYTIPADNDIAQNYYPDKTRIDYRFAFTNGGFINSGYVAAKEKRGDLTLNAGISQTTQKTADLYMNAANGTSETITYRIYEGASTSVADAETKTLLATTSGTAGNNTTYTMRDLTPNTEYVYTIVAEDQAGQKAFQVVRPRTTDGTVVTEFDNTVDGTAKYVWLMGDDSSNRQEVPYTYSFNLNYNEDGTLTMVGGVGPQGEETKSMTDAVGLVLPHVYIKKYGDAEFTDVQAPAGKPSQFFYTTALPGPYAKGNVVEVKVKYEYNGQNGESQFTTPTMRFVVDNSEEAKTYHYFDEAHTTLDGYHGTSNRVRIVRSLKDGNWNTFTIPFDLTKSELEEILNTHKDNENTVLTADVEYLSGLSLNEKGEYSMHFKSVAADSDLKAGKPYLIKLSGKDHEVDGLDANASIKSFDLVGNEDRKTIDLNTVVPEPDVVLDNGMSVSFHSTYTFMNTSNYVPRGSYIFNQSKLYHVNSNVQMYGFRGYFTVEGDESSSAKLVAYVFDIDDDDLTNGINNNVLNDYVIDPTKPVYNIEGQRVSPTAKGILIQNGHKFVIK